MPTNTIDLSVRHARPEPPNFNVAVVTGARGFIGSRLVAVLREVCRVPVVAFDMEGWPETPDDDGLVKVMGDARSFDDIDGVLNEAEDFIDIVPGGKDPRLAVFHLAAHSSNSPAMSRESMDLNAGVPARIYREISDRFGSIARFVFASSFGVYGQNPAGSFVVEGHDCYLRPMTNYGRSKLLAEHAIEVEQYGLLPDRRPSAVSLRLSNVIGCGGVSKGGLPITGPSGGVVRSLIEAVAGRRPLHIVQPLGGVGASLSPVRDFVHVDDVVRAMVFAAGRQFDDHKAINICTVIGTPIERLPQLAGIDYVRDLEYAPKYDALYSRGDNTKARLELDWIPRVSVAEAVREIVEAARPEAG